jgi:hypothetical protein
VDGFQVAYKSKHNLGGKEAEVTYTRVEHNVDIAADRFDLPPDIRKLAEKKKDK